MTFYNNLTKTSPLASVEFTPVSDGNLTFFTARDPIQKEALKLWLTSPEISQNVVAEAKTRTGMFVMVTQGDKSRDEMIKAIEAQGNTLQIEKPKKSIDPWRIVSLLAVPGQVLQLASSFMRKDKKLDWGLFAFATSNLTGHIISWIYGAQQSEDKHRLNFVKQQINDGLTDHLPEGEELPGIDEKRSALRAGPPQPPSTGEKINSFLKKNSVYIGEIFCRYLGAFALAFPMNKWKAAGKAMETGGIGAAYKAGRSANADGSASLTHLAGLGSLMGKSTSFLAAPEDPYNPEPKSAIQTLREKYLFRTGGWMEVGAFGTLTYDAFNNPNRRILFRGKEYPDFVGGIGSALFTLRYMVRHFAKFGVKNVNMQEVYAHATDSLAKMPPEKLPQLVAETAADLTEHFTDKHIHFGEMYTQLMNDLYRYHHIALGKTGVQPPTPVAEVPQDSVPLQETPKPAMGTRSASAPTQPRPASVKRPIAPISNYADNVRSAETPLALGT